MTTAPILYSWNGEAMIPHRRFQAECDRTFVVGENYRLAIHEDRSTASHNHEFAFVAEAWAQLPEHLAEQFRTPEHLRKRALISAGYFNQQEVDHMVDVKQLMRTIFRMNEISLAYVLSFVGFVFLWAGQERLRKLCWLSLLGVGVGAAAGTIASRAVH